MIPNAKDVPLNQAGGGNLPNMGSTLQGWFQPMTFTLVTQQNIDGILYPSETTVSSRGVRQPMSARQLQIKPEGERAWKWETMHCLPEVILKTDDVIVFNAVRFRVMQVWDWREYGYREYHLVRDYDTVAG